MKSVAVFGSTGVIGTSLCALLSKEYPDARILAVTRNSSNPSRLSDMNLPNVKVVEGDPENKESVLQITEPCDYIFCCVGFKQYQRKYWAKHWPPLMENMLAATTQGDKTRKFIFCDNIYAYGNPAPSAINTKSTKVKAGVNGKPYVRAMLHEKIQAHMHEYPGTVTVVGGADFFGPHATEISILGDTFTGNIMDGKAAYAFASANKIHDFCYVADFAKSLAVAAANENAYDHFWICPHSIHGKTIQEIADQVAVYAGKTTPAKVTVLSKFMMYLLTPFMGFMYEMIEMCPFWSQDYRVDDSEMTQAFGLTATPADEALKALVDFYKDMGDKK